MDAAGSTSSTQVHDARPRVGVVVPAYQVERYVAQTLRSVQAQSYSDWECVVVDDGSSDGTAAVVQDIAVRDPRIRLHRQSNQGLSAARNAGVAQLSDSVQFVAFLDSDDLWLPNALDHLVDALAADAGAAGAYGYAEFIDGEGRPFDPGVHPDRQRARHRVDGWRVRRVGELEPVTFDEWVVAGPLWPPAVALHRGTTLHLAGPFDTSLRQAEDVDFYTRMGRMGHYVAVGRQVAWYRQHPGQMTQRRAEFWFAHDTVRHKTWQSPDNTAAQRRAVLVAWRWAQARRIARCVLRLSAAVRHRDWDRVRRLARGLGVLAVQMGGGGPPPPRLEHVLLTGRDV
jgi:glycosyltransferase involved in cell wall biosynthesis